VPEGLSAGILPKAETQYGPRHLCCKGERSLWPVALASVCFLRNLSDFPLYWYNTKSCFHRKSLQEDIKLI